LRQFRLFALLISSLIGSLLLHGQSPTVYGWSSFGVLPFHGYDFIVFKAPTRYVMYFTQLAADGSEGPTNPPGRAFSPDLKTWTQDPNDVCSTSGELCSVSIRRAGAFTLPDGRIRMFLFGGAGLLSAISLDGVVWTSEPGTRFANDSSSVYEHRGPRWASFVPLADGSVRMYFSGGVVPGSAGTPTWYNGIFDNGMILSAVSKDNGVTWVRDPGVRINPLVQGPVTNLVINGVNQNQFACGDVTAVSLTENGQGLFRVYCPGGDATVSYVSKDGLFFALESKVPADQGDAKAFVMPDGRTWLITNGPAAIDDMLIYGPQSLFLKNVQFTGGPKPFGAATMGVTGSTAGPVTFEAVDGEAGGCGNLVCAFHPEYYSFSPSSGTAPFSTVVSYTGAAGYFPSDLMIHAKSAGATAAGAIFCMSSVLGRSDTDVFCKSPLPDLPMNKMSFAFSSAVPGGAAAVTQTSNILSLGGQGYPFTVASSVPWATVSPASGTAPAPLAIKVDPTGLAPGTYTGGITIMAEGTIEQVTVNVTLSTGPVITAVLNAASAAPAITPNSFATIYGTGFTASGLSWSPTTTLPSSLGGVSATINGKTAYLSYAGPGQINVLTPPDTATGQVAVQVTTSTGTTTSTATLSPVAPSWFTYSLGGPTVVAPTWIAALIVNPANAGTVIYVAPAGSLGAQTTRSAKAGDFLALYANGLGATTPAAPEGVVLTTAYPVDDLSRIKVTIAGHDVPVLFAGLVGAGLYQINIQVPAGLDKGELPVEMYVSGQPTQGGVTLNFQ